jgi:hypothetical protein
MKRPERIGTGGGVFGDRINMINRMGRDGVEKAHVICALR